MIQALLERSRATVAFRSAVMDFVATGAPADRISFDRRSPAVKVERVVTMLLESEPDLPIDGVSIDGRSGCEYFRGEVTVSVADGADHIFRFDWDCRWRALDQGWTDYFGFPDQTRAAREFGYDCFRVWERRGGESAAA